MTITDNNSGILERCKIFGETEDGIIVPRNEGITVNMNRNMVIAKPYIENDNALKKSAIGAKFLTNENTAKFITSINNSGRAFKGNIEKNKKNYDTKYNLKVNNGRRLYSNYIDYYSNILCDRTVNDDANYELNTIQDHILNFIKTRGSNNISNIRFKEVMCMAKSNALQRMFPVNKLGIAVGFVREYNHINEDNKWFDLVRNLHIWKNDGNNNNCRLNPVLRKRGEIQCSSNYPKINYSIDINNSLINILNLFNENKIELGEFSSYVNDEDQLKELYKSPEKFEILCENLSKYFVREMDKFDLNQKKEFITEFNNLINGLKDYISKPESSEHIGNIKEKNIQNVEKYFGNMYSFYLIKNNELIDDEGEDLITHISYNQYSNSDYHNDKLLYILDKLVKILSKNENSGIGVKINGNLFSEEIDPKTIANSDDLDVTINELCKRIDELDISRIDELKSIINEVEIIKNTIIYELYKNGDPSVNTELVLKVYNAINNKIGSIDNNIDIITSKNQLKFNTLENSNDNNKIIEYLTSNTISSENKNYIFKGLAYNIVNSKELVLNKDMTEILMEIKLFIESKRE